MSVAFDAVGSGHVGSNPLNTLTFTHVLGAGATAIGVGFYNYEGPGGKVPTGVTVGGVPLTQVVRQPGGGNGNSVAYLYGVASGSLPTGLQNVVITFAGTGSFTQAGSISVSGSDTTTCFSNTNGSATSAGTSSSLSVTSAVGELVMDVVGNTIGAVLAAGGSQTLKWGPYNDSNEGAGSIQAGAASVTMAWTWTGAGDSAAAGGSFKAAGAGGFFSRPYYDLGTRGSNV